MTFLSLLQDMYQYVLSKDVDPPFSLCVLRPRSLLVCGYGSVCPYKDVLIIVETESSSYDLTILDQFSELNVS